MLKRVGNARLENAECVPISDRLIVKCTSPRDPLKPKLSLVRSPVKLPGRSFETVIEPGTEGSRPSRLNTRSPRRNDEDRKLYAAKLVPLEASGEALMSYVSVAVIVDPGWIPLVKGLAGPLTPY